MKKLLIIFTTVILISCSNSEKDRLVYFEFNLQKQDLISWIKYLKNIDGKEIDKAEIKRLYFLKNMTTPQVYQKIIFYKTYFNLSSKDFNTVELNKLLDKKDELCSVFYTCHGEIEIKKLLRIEQSLYEKYQKIDELINYHLGK